MYDKSLIMKRAWHIYRKHNHQLSWSDSMKQSWGIAKNDMANLNITTIYQKHYTQIFYHILGKVNGNKSVAEELAQDVFVKVNDHLHEYDVDRAKLLTWVYTIANHKVIDHYRTDKSDRYTSVDGYVDNEGNVMFEHESDDTDHIEAEDTEMAIKRALSKLNDNERMVATMYFMEEKKYIEIAEECDLPMGTVKGLINRSRAKLQTTLSSVYATM
jgi:RNA polymerase sigma factor (sigma-70 family)